MGPRTDHGRRLTTLERPLREVEDRPAVAVSSEWAELLRLDRGHVWHPYGPMPRAQCRRRAPRRAARWADRLERFFSHVELRPLDGVVTPLEAPQAFAAAIGDAL